MLLGGSTGCPGMARLLTALFDPLSFEIEHPPSPPLPAQRRQHPVWAVLSEASIKQQQNPRSLRPCGWFAPGAPTTPPLPRPFGLLAPSGGAVPLHRLSELVGGSVPMDGPVPRRQGLGHQGRGQHHHHQDQWHARSREVQGECTTRRGTAPNGTCSSSRRSFHPEGKALLRLFRKMRQLVKRQTRNPTRPSRTWIYYCRSTIATHYCVKIISVAGVLSCVCRNLLCFLPGGGFRTLLT